MNWSSCARVVTFSIVFLGASALTAVILFVPDLGPGVFAALVAARLTLGLARWTAITLIGKKWLAGGDKRPDMLATAG